MLFQLCLVTLYVTSALPLCKLLLRLLFESLEKLARLKTSENQVVELPENTNISLQLNRVQLFNTNIYVFTLVKPFIIYAVYCMVESIIQCA